MAAVIRCIRRMYYNTRHWAIMYYTYLQAMAPLSSPASSGHTVEWRPRYFSCSWRASSTHVPQHSACTDSQRAEARSTRSPGGCVACCTEIEIDDGRSVAFPVGRSPPLHAATPRIGDGQPRATGTAWHLLPLLISAEQACRVLRALRGRPRNARFRPLHTAVADRAAGRTTAGLARIGAVAWAS